MLNVDNRKAISLITRRFMKINRGRNLAALLSILLTTLLFTSLFTAVLSMVLSRQAADMKSYVNYCHLRVSGLSAEENQALSAALSADDEVSRYGVGICLGEPEDGEIPFQTQLWYGDRNMADSFQCMPALGRLPMYDDEIAAGTLLLDALGVPHRLGEEVRLPGHSQTFRLCGWWEGDRDASAQLAWVAEAYALDFLSGGADSAADSDDSADSLYQYSIWFHSSWDLEGKTARLAGLAGFSQEEATSFQINPTFLYLTAEDGFSFRPVIILSLVILLAGCLMIYNIFSISVRLDLRAYALLKNVGATGKQLKKVVRRQALLLSAAGIPPGLLAGWGVGQLLAPALTANLDIRSPDITVICPHPAIFLAAAALTLATVYLSSLQACRIVSRVSPVEALRLADQDSPFRRSRRTVGRLSVWACMAAGNIIHNWKKGLIVMLSIALSLVTVNSVAILTEGYDFHPYEEIFLDFDFQLSGTGTTSAYSSFQSITPQIRQLLDVCPYAVRTGYVYFSGESHRMEPHLLETWEEITGLYLEQWGGEWAEIWEGISSSGQIPIHYMGISETVFQMLEWSGQPCSWEEFSRGDTVIVSSPRRFLPEGAHYYQTGEKISMEFQSGQSRQYQVIGEGSLPYALDYPFNDLISVTLLVPEQEFIASTGIDSAMTAGTDAIDGTEEKMQQFMEDIILREDSSLRLTSSLELNHVFQRYLDRYYIGGSGLALVLAFIGMLNFANTSAASILSRSRELALLEAAGMTSRQIRRMLTIEGLIYLAGGFLISLALSLTLAGPLLTRTLGRAFFFHASVTVLPSLFMLPFLAAAAIAIPAFQRRSMEKQSISDRVRQLSSAE